jgi:hypothetical protein
MILVNAQATLTTERTMLMIRDSSLLLRVGAWHAVAVTFFVTDGTLSDGNTAITDRAPTQDFFECTARKQARLHIVL